MRSFIALEIPENVQRDVYLLNENIPSDSARIKWVKKENIHLTLLFLGEIVEDALPQIKESISTVAGKHNSFSMSLQNIGVFPNFRRPRVIWVGVSPESKDSIVNIEGDLANALTFLRLDTRKGFTPHITFGRIKSVYNSTSLKMSIESISFNTELFPVKEITLFKSVLKPDGAVYTPISKFPLQPIN